MYRERERESNATKVCGCKERGRSASMHLCKACSLYSPSKPGKIECARLNETDLVASRYKGMEGGEGFDL